MLDTNCQIPLQTSASVLRRGWGYYDQIAAEQRKWPAGKGHLSAPAATGVKLEAHHGPLVSQRNVLVVFLGFESSTIWLSVASEHIYLESGEKEREGALSTPQKEVK